MFKLKVFIPIVILLLGVVSLANWAVRTGMVDQFGVVPAGQIVITGPETPVFIGESMRLTAVVLDVRGNPIPSPQVIWSTNLGEVDSTGGFTAGRELGIAKIAATVSYGRATVTTTKEVAIENVPVGEVVITGPKTPVFTGDSMPLNLAVVDVRGNPIPNPQVSWAATLGQVDSSGKFTAGRQPGTAAVTATVTHGKATVTDTRSVQVKMGYCTTTTEASSWDFSWYALNGDRSRGAPLGSSTAGGNFSFNWKRGPVFAGRADHIMLIGRTTIVVQRHGPVLFRVGSDDGFKLLLNGQPIMSHWQPRPYAQNIELIELRPGIYDLELHYYDLGSYATLNFFTDADVLRWTVANNCFGGFIQAPGTRYFLLPKAGISVTEAAEQFGLDDAEIASLNPQSRGSLILPGTRSNAGHTKAIYIPGIDSSSSCSPADGTSARRKAVIHAIQSLSLETTGMVSLVDSGDVYSLGYSGQYMECESGRRYSTGSLSNFPTPVGYHPGSRVSLTPTPVYAGSDTCGGVQRASEHLARLVSEIRSSDPEAKFVIIGHSLGGMVAAYYASQESPQFVRERIQRIVTIDSPLLGHPFNNPLSGCHHKSQSWVDINANGNVTAAIRGIQDQSLLGRIMTVNATNVGDWIHGGENISSGCGWTLLFVFPIGHDCAFGDPKSRLAFSRAFNIRSLEDGV